jgi:O-antigen/teichoic acid export membrane protein
MTHHGSSLGTAAPPDGTAGHGTPPLPAVRAAGPRPVTVRVWRSTARQVPPAVAALRRAGPLAVVGLAANGANVFVTVAVAHLLDARAYGTLGQLLVLFLVLSMPGSALLVAVVRRVAAWEAAGEGDRVAPWVATIRRRGLVALVAWAVVAWLIRAPVASLMSLPSSSGVAEVLIAGGGWAILSVERGLIQSRREYGTLAANLSVEAAARMTLTVGLVAAGLGVEGAALGLVVAMAASVIHARWALARGVPLGVVTNEDGQADRAEVTSAPTGAVSTEPTRNGSTGAGPESPETDAPASAEPIPILEEDVPRVHHMAADLSTALAALALLAVLQGLDVLVVGSQSPGHIGSYNAISVACKAVVFLATALSGYLLPEAVLRWHQGQHALRQLVAAVGLVLVPTAGLTVVAVAVPHQVLQLFFGSDKTGAASAFATLSLAMGCLAITALCTYYLLGIGRRRVVPVLAVATAVTFALVSTAHGQPLATARTELACQGTLALIAVALVMMASRHLPSGNLASP